MAVTGWFYRSFANSFTLCLIGSFGLQALLEVSWLFTWSRQARLTANSEKNSGYSKATGSPARTRQVKEQKKGAATIESNARSASQVEQVDQAEREAVGERTVEPASHRHWRLAADQRTQGPAKRWPVGAFSSNPLPLPKATFLAMSLLNVEIFPRPSPRQLAQSRHGGCPGRETSPGSCPDSPWQRRESGAATV